jgi:hypothetical protein
MPAPTVPPAPPRLSMITWRPSERVSTAVSGRAKASVPPPAGKGTTNETGRVGQPAWAPRGTDEGQGEGGAGGGENLASAGAGAVVGSGMGSVSVGV